MTDRPIIIRNACILTGEGRVIPSGFVAVKDGVIFALGPDSKRPRIGGAQVIDAAGRYVLPGFINSHMHLYSMLALGAPVSRMRTFGEVLKDLWWRLDRVLTLEDVHVSSLLGGVACVRAGVTTVFDHHASYGAIRGSLHTVSDALRQVGIRASLCFEISDRAGKASRDEAASETTSFLEYVRARVARDPGFAQRGMVGLHASQTLSDSTLDSARELMDVYGVGAHVHVAESELDVEITRRKYRSTPVARLVRHGILRRGSIAAHCVHLAPADLPLLAGSKVTVAHNPMSNLANAVGVAPVLAMAKRGIPVAIGTDGMAAGISPDATLAAVLHRTAAKDAQAGFREVNHAVCRTAPLFASAAFGCTVGTIKKGACADLIIVDSVPRTPVTAANAAAHLVFGALAAPVRTTIVAGRVLMRDFAIPGLDEFSLAARGRKLAVSLWKRL